MQRRSEAQTISYTGRFEELVDLYRGTVEEDGYLGAGILGTMSHGILGLDQEFQGDPAMVSALRTQDGTAGDDDVMTPEVEAAKIFSDGIGLGIGLGQDQLVCWRCGSLDWARVRAATTSGDPDVERGAGRFFEVCTACDAARLDRPYGVRELFALQHRDPRWVYRNPINLQWYFSGRRGLLPFRPGDGEWFLFSTVPDIDPWRHGNWVWGTMAAIFARDAAYDRQAVSAMAAPQLVLESDTVQNPNARQEAERKARELNFQNRWVMPYGWKASILQAKAEYVEVCDNISRWARQMYELGTTGTFHSVESGPGFSNMSVFQRTTNDRRAFLAGAWCRQKRKQRLSWWGLDNFGTREVPSERLDVRAPEDKLADAAYLEKWGTALTAYQAGLSAHGLEADPADIIEQMQRIGRRVRIKPAGASGKLNLGVEQVAAVAMGDEARASLGLPSFATRRPGDPRDAMTISDLQNAGKGGGAPAQPPAPPNLNPTRPRRRAARAA